MILDAGTARKQHYRLNGEKSKANGKYKRLNSLRYQAEKVVYFFLRAS
jgi:hypothetical protein